MPMPPEPFWKGDIWLSLFSSLIFLSFPFLFFLSVIMMMRWYIVEEGHGASKVRLWSSQENGRVKKEQFPSFYILFSTLGIVPFWIIETSDVDVDVELHLGLFVAGIMIMIMMIITSLELEFCYYFI